MPISYISGASGTNTVTLGTHAAGDLILLFAYRDGNNAAPTIPAGQNWTTVYTATGANTNAHTVVRKIAASAAETVGTFTNATGCVAMVFRGVDQTTPIGAHLQGGAQSTTVAYNGITLQVQNATSWIAAFAGHRSTNTTLESPPGALTNRVTRVDATCEVAGHSSAAGTSTWTTTNVSVGGTSSGWRSHVVELRAATQNDSGGSNALIGAIPLGEGTATEILAGSSTGTVTATASGSGSGAEAATSSATATVTATATGAGSPQETATGSTTTTVTATASGAGDAVELVVLVYVVAYPSTLADPSVAQVLAGQDETGSPALWSSSTPAATVSGTYTFPTPATGLTAGTGYKHAVVWTNGVVNSTVAVSDEWFTADPAPELTLPTAAVTGSTVTLSITLTF